MVYQSQDNDKPGVNFSELYYWSSQCPVWIWDRLDVDSLSNLDLNGCICGKQGYFASFVYAITLNNSKLVAKLISVFLARSKLREFFYVARGRFQSHSRFWLPSIAQWRIRRLSVPRISKAWEPGHFFSWCTKLWIAVVNYSRLPLGQPAVLPHPGSRGWKKELKYNLEHAKSNLTEGPAMSNWCWNIAAKPHLLLSFNFPASVNRLKSLRL